jgi:Immune inhibitor A-like, MAM domain
LSTRFSRVLLALVAALAFSTSISVASAAAAGSPGDETLTLGVGDDVAGGETQITFQKYFSGTTLNGTPVYVYAPVGGVGDVPTGVEGADPQWDPNPDDEFEPCATNATTDHQIRADQLTGLGNELVGNADDPGIVQVDTDHYGPIGEAKPGDPDSKALVVLAYDIRDESYYDCDASQYTVGYFAPQFIDEDGMNVIVIDNGFWDEMVGDPQNATNLTIEGVLAHELEHLLHNYSDAGELSWVDEGLADFAIFLNDYPIGGSHPNSFQINHRETSLTRWGGTVSNYGAAASFFQYLWERAGGNGGGDLEPDQQNDHTAGDQLIQLIFKEQENGVDGVQNAIDAYNASNGTAADLPDVATLFQDWSVAVYLDDEGSSLFDIHALNFGDPGTSTYTIALVNEIIGRDFYNGAVPEGKYQSRLKHGKAGAPSALPYGVSYQSYRNPGNTFSATLNGADTTAVAPHSGPDHWYAGYESQSDHVLAVDDTDVGGKTLDFWSWWFIEEGWDYAFVEQKVNGEWETVPLLDEDNNVVTTDLNPQGNNTEGNGLTGTSGGAYFVDDPEYLHLHAQLDPNATDVQFRYSTDAAYLDTGWFIDDVTIGGAAADLAPEAAGEWVLTNGEQDNNWALQVISPCDLTPGTTSRGEIADAAGGNWIYRFTGEGGAPISSDVYSTKCLGQRRIATVVSNLPTGDLTSLDAPYSYALNPNPRK